MQYNIIYILVVSDCDLVSFLCRKVRVHHLIHHTLPPNGLLFRLRLTILYHSIPRGCGPVKGCVSTILLTPQCKAQSASILSMVEKLERDAPRELLEMARKRKDVCKSKRWYI